MAVTVRHHVVTTVEGKCQMSAPFTFKVKCCADVQKQHKQKSISQGAERPASPLTGASADQNVHVMRRFSKPPSDDPWATVIHLYAAEATSNVTGQNYFRTGELPIPNVCLVPTDSAFIWGYLFINISSAGVSRHFMFAALAVLPALALSTYIDNLQLIRNSAEPMCTLGWVHAVSANFIQKAFYGREKIITQSRNEGGRFSRRRRSMRSTIWNICG